LAGPDVELWKQVFQELIQEVKPWHKWTLTVDKDLLPNSLKPGWSQYQQWAFARFQCSLCSRSWSSAQVQVLFHMHKSAGNPRGKVKMRVFAQRCRKCSQSPFEVPKFTEENISRILNNLVFRILKKCYREGFKSVEEIPTIKEISLEGPHDSNNCEACLQGFCARSGLGEAVQSPMSPLLPAISSPALGTAIPTPSPARKQTRICMSVCVHICTMSLADTGSCETSATISRQTLQYSKIGRDGWNDLEYVKKENQLENGI
uniref:3CxxC-type domain-containing protein n=1 Tax=Ursus americanus TaxID=9643 RepID=A0A452Q9A8_URSAM